MDLQPGTRIERYVIEARINAGSLATSYRVRHVTLETLHHLMVQNTPIPALRNRLVSGARIQARLRHPHVVASTDVLDIDGLAGVVLDHVEGATLDEMISAHDFALPSALDVPTTDTDAVLAEVDALANGLFEGVGWLHRNGVVHRNLKSRNVVVDLGGQAAMPKVTDFTLARVLGERGPVARKKARVFGTPEFMAPEQTLDSESVDHRADVWSLGVILYHLVTGKLPFGGTTSDEVFAAVRSGAFTPVHELAPGAPQRWVDAIRATLTVNPDRRAWSPDAVAHLWFGGLGARPRVTRSPPVGRVTLVFTDIQGSTRIWETRPDLARNSLRAHDALMRAALHRHGGYEVKTEGDAFMVAFAQPINAIRFCVDVQRQLHEHPWSPELLALPECREEPGFRGVRVRMGVHVGEPEARADGDRVDYFGPMVNRAARIAQAGHGGQILVSHELWDEVKHGIDAVVSHPLGSYRLKGLDAPQSIVQLVPTDVAERRFDAVKATAL